MAGLVQKFKQMWTPPEDEYDYDFEEMDMDDEEVMDEISSSSYEEEEAYQEPQRESRRSSAPQSGNKVVETFTPPPSFRWFSLSRSVSVTRPVPWRMSC